MLRMRFKEKQSNQKTIPKLVRTREECTASLAPLRVVVYQSLVSISLYLSCLYMSYEKNS